MTEENRDLVKKWLDSKWPRDKQECDVCGSSSWQIANHLVTPNAIHSNGGVTLGGMVYPQAMAICMNCGQTKYFNAAMMGVQKPGEPKDG